MSRRIGKYLQEPLNYAKANAKLGSSDFLELCRNTFLERLEYSKAIVVRHWYTNIITFYPNGDIVINTNGWWISTTKERINTYLEDTCQVYNGQFGPTLSRNGIDYEYKDGILIDGKGIVHAAISQPPIVRYMENLLGIKTGSKEEALAKIVFLTNKQLWSLWQRCASLRTFIASLCPVTFLPLTIASDDKRGQARWKDVVIRRLDGEQYSIADFI
jgi:hypothetical protein